MSILGRQVSARRAGTGALLMLVLASALALARVPPEPRQVVLVARGMAFYLESDPATPNPRIQVRAGERVRFVLRNDDAGYTHDVAVPAARAASPLIGAREQAQITFAAPDEPGIYEYHCRPHLLMMRGVLEVLPD